MFNCKRCLTNFQIPRDWFSSCVILNRLPSRQHSFESSLLPFQGLMNNKNFERSAEQEKIEKRRLVSVYKCA